MRRAERARRCTVPALVPALILALALAACTSPAERDAASPGESSSASSAATDPATADPAAGDATPAEDGQDAPAPDATTAEAGEDGAAEDGATVAATPNISPAPMGGAKIPGADLGQFCQALLAASETNPATLGEGSVEGLQAYYGLMSTAFANAPTQTLKTNLDTVVTFMATLLEAIGTSNQNLTMGLDGEAFMAAMTAVDMEGKQLCS